MVCFFSVNCVRLVTVLCKQARQRLSRLRQWSAGIIRKYCCHFMRRETWTTVSGRPYQQNNYTVVAPPSKTYFSWGGHLLVSNPQMFSLGPFRWAPSLQWLWTLAMKIDEGCFVDLSDGAVTMGKLLGACLLGLLNPRPPVPLAPSSFSLWPGIGKSGLVNHGSGKVGKVERQERIELHKRLFVPSFPIPGSPRPFPMPFQHEECICGGKPRMLLAGT